VRCGFLQRNPTALLTLGYVIRRPYSPNHPENRSCKIGSVIHDWSGIGSAMQSSTVRKRGSETDEGVPRCVIQLMRFA
jgi:hypothetical protein